MKLPPTPPPDGHPAPGEEDPAARVARLTALALGELSAAEAGALEAEIWRDGEARLELEKIRSLAEHLTFAYASEPPTTLTPAQHRAILERSACLTGSDEKEARLTAYALGELRPSQAEVLSARLTGDRAATLELEAVGALAARLRSAFADEPVQLLTPQQRQAVIDYGQQRQWEPHEPAPPESFTVVDSATAATTAQTPPASRPSRRWLRTAAVAAGFSALGYLLSTHDHPVGTEAVVRAPDALPAAHEAEFFPPRPPASNPESPQLIALLDREKRRPSAATARSPQTAPTPRPDVIKAAATAEAAVAPAADALPAPRRQPDASVLPPPPENTRPRSRTTGCAGCADDPAQPAHAPRR